ncbi:hypothetical protein HYH03_008702 [Edaphochlamys debaryana]|uniref:PhoD-like phosphatase domain-containing protein n=1 Tax=Edaphochlamys debaryana TaxID=47281 RepID=A0A835Y8L5_9CHLO|nr:hypothetical protein HYH03_008702 [Edaphochlamys debaryana]|eukprot:KAG2493039.1 hypothetical protein HYH03_008702 [Edaphochlamys debaryana]
MGCGTSRAHARESATLDAFLWSLDGAPPPPTAILPYYNLKVLGERNAFGPFLKFISYNPETGEYRISVLVVLHAQAEDKALTEGGNGQAAPTLKYTLADTRTESSHVPVQQGPGVGAQASDPDGEAGPGGQASRPQPTSGGIPPGTECCVTGELLDSCRDFRFWRWDLATTCLDRERELQYQVNLLPGRTFSLCVPPHGDRWRVAFYSCNELHDPADAKRTRGIQPLWRDLQQRHAEAPFHALIGAGDQLYNDAVFQGPLLRGWDTAQNDRDTEAKAALPFTDALKCEVEEFYFSHYAHHFSQPVYEAMLASIPSLNVWDDHDIVDGWGSYPEVVQGAAIMQGVFAAAQKFYLLFQHHATLDRLSDDGYWCDSTTAQAYLGGSTSLIMADGRTHRSQLQIMRPDFYQRLEAHLRSLPDSVRHVVLMLGVPACYPKLPVQDTLQKLDDVTTNNDSLLATVMQKTGLANTVTKRFGMVFILDDIIDQWSSHQHASERDRLMLLLMRLAEERDLRISLLSGDVHCGGYGMFHSSSVERGDVEDMRLPEAEELARDPKFIPQIISSAIANVPPPTSLLKVLCMTARNPRPFLEDCVERMVPLFGPEHDTNSLLLGRRNWCELTLGAADNGIDFWIRAEKELGSEEVNVFHIHVPPLVG